MDNLMNEGIRRIISEIHGLDPEKREWVNEDFVKIKLGMWFQSKNCEVYPEINTGKSGMSKKKELDLLLEYPDGDRYGLEISFPLKSHGETTDAIFKIWKDVEYLEDLKEAETITKGYFLMITDNPLFWYRRHNNGVGRMNRSMYSCIRNGNDNGNISILENMRDVTLLRKYSSNWMPEAGQNGDAVNGLRYFSISV